MLLSRSWPVCGALICVTLVACQNDSPSPSGADPDPNPCSVGDGPGCQAPGDGDHDSSDDRPPADEKIVDTGYDPEPLRSGPFYVLFDNSHGEDASNADWVIDNNWPNPSPASPGDAEDWSGAYSSWGFDLWDTGRYVVRTLPPSGRITYNDSNNAQDLSNYDLFILPEPNNPFTMAEKTAILDFVQAGGGLFMVSDHADADRDSDGWDAVEALNDLMSNNGRATNIFGITFYPSGNFSEHPITNLADLPDSRILHGPFGEVTGMSIYNGTSLTLNLNKPEVRGLIWRNGYPHTSTFCDFATSRYGLGRVAAVGDSSPADDGTANPGNSNIENGWTEAGVTNNILFLNTSAWLVRDAGP